MSGKIGTVLFNKSVSTFRKLMAIQRYCETLSIYKMNNVKSYFAKAIKVDQIPYSSNKCRASNQRNETCETWIKFSADYQNAMLIGNLTII